MRRVVFECVYLVFGRSGAGGRGEVRPARWPNPSVRSWEEGGSGPSQLQIRNSRETSSAATLSLLSHPPCLPSLTATQVISWSWAAIPLYLDDGCSFTWKSISLKKSNQPLSSSSNLSNLKLGFQIERYCPIPQNQCSVLKQTIASISSHRWSKAGVK